MEIILDMKYDLPAMAAMAKAVRKGLQEDRDKKSKLIGWFFVVAGTALVFSAKAFTCQQIIALVAIVLFAVYLLLPDQINGLISLYKIPAKVRSATWKFCDDGFHITTIMDSDSFLYDSIFAMVETDGYLVLCFHNSQAQVYSLNSIVQGTAADLRRILRRETGLTIQEI